MYNLKKWIEIILKDPYLQWSAFKKMKDIRISLILNWQSNWRTLIVLLTNTKDEETNKMNTLGKKNPLSEWIVPKLKYNLSKS